MSSCKLLLLLMAGLAVFMCAQSQARDLCQRPKNSFENLNHLHDYVECLKSQTTTRYGKRAYPPSILARIRPDAYNKESLQQLYEMLYDDN